MSVTFEQREAKRAEVERNVLAFLAAAGRPGLIVEEARDRPIDIGENIRVVLHLEEPTRGVPRWRIKLTREHGNDGSWFHEGRAGFQYAEIANACVDILMDVRRERQAREKRNLVENEAHRIDRLCGFEGTDFGVREHRGRVVFEVRDAPITEAQALAMDAAARGCGLLPPKGEK